jgi:hypothetical protein
VNLSTYLSNLITETMKNRLSVLAFSVLLVFAACQKQELEMDSQEPASAEAFQTDLKSMAAGKQAVLNFRAHLSGDQEVPPVETRATGQAIFQLSKDGTELSYRLIVANIENVTQAHIHLGPAGTNGPVVAWLYPSGPPPQLIPGRSSGVLATGVITADNLVGPLANASLSDLIDAMAAGNTYVNVHTSQFPPGEVRGQIFGNVK